MIHPQSLLPSQAAILSGVGASSQCYYWDELMLVWANAINVWANAIKV